MNFIKKNIAGIIIVLAFIGIGTCNYILNTSDQNERINNPKAGQYYVINDFTEDTPEIILKIKEVRDNEIEFFVPRQELIFGWAQLRFVHVPSQAAKLLIRMSHRFDKAAALREYNFSTIFSSQKVDAFLKRRLMIRRMPDSIIPLPHMSLLSS